MVFHIRIAAYVLTEKLGNYCLVIKLMNSLIQDILDRVITLMKADFRKAKKDVSKSENETEWEIDLRSSGIYTFRAISKRSRRGLPEMGLCVAATPAYKNLRTFRHGYKMET